MKQALLKRMKAPPFLEAVGPGSIPGGINCGIPCCEITLHILILWGNDNFDKPTPTRLVSVLMKIATNPHNRSALFFSRYMAAATMTNAAVTIP